MINIFVFNEGYANNWVKGQEVECELTDGGILVDGVALIPAEELLKHGEFKDQQPQVEATKTAIKSKALELWQELNESELPYEDFVGVQEHILTLFSDIN